MNNKLPVLPAADVVHALQKAGFEIQRLRASHCVLTRDSHPRISLVVPLHGSRDMKPGTLRAISQQAELTVEQFNALLL